MLASRAGLWFKLISLVPHVGFEGGTVVLVVPDQRHCLPFTFKDSVISLLCYFRLYI